MPPSSSKEDVMDAAALHQFLKVLLIAIGALCAAPLAVFFAEGGERRDQRRISTQHPVMQY